MSEESKKTVLMIEDDNFLRKLYRDKIEREGIHFIEAVNVLEGMNKVATERPDIIILDMLLPRGSGFDFLEQIKKSESLRDIPVLVLSMLEQEQDLIEAKRKGCHTYFKKSEATAEDLLKVIKEI